jgi:hypothetical protein
MALYLNVKQGGVFVVAEVLFQKLKYVFLSEPPISPGPDAVGYQDTHPFPAPDGIGVDIKQASYLGDG